MDCEHSKAIRMNIEGDRLSILPNDLIHRILSFMSIKHAIATSSLSSRWRFIWTSMPYFNISSANFLSLPDFRKFVNHVLSRRDSQIELYSVNLCFHQTVCEALLKTILDYAFSRNLQRLTITCFLDEKIDFPIHLIRSRSLKYLRLTGSANHFHDGHSIIIPPTWDLPALTTLHLDHVALYHDNDVGLFSKCANLKKLTLNNFNIEDSYNFTIYHPRISNLTLENAYWTVSGINVVAPLLENLTIRSFFGKHLIGAPNVASLVYHSSRLLEFSSDFCLLEKVDLCINSTDKWSGCNIAALLQQLQNVKFLTLNLEFVEPLISYMEMISPQHPPFSNLSSLKIYPVSVPSDDEAHKKVNLSTEVIKYLLEGSPTATFTLISYEEVKEKQQKAQAFANAIEAQNLMVRLQAMLEKEKADIERNRTLMDQGMENHKADAHDQGMAPVEKMQLHFKRKMKQMKKCWEDVGVQIDQGKRNTRYIISQLRDIEVLLLKDLPALKRDELQACFSNLCAEVDTLVKKILHCISIPQINLSDCFNELASTSLQSS